VLPSLSLPVLELSDGALRIDWKASAEATRSASDRLSRGALLGTTLTLSLSKHTSLVSASESRHV